MDLKFLKTGLINSEFLKLLTALIHRFIDGKIYSMKNYKSIQQSIITANIH